MRGCLPVFWKVSIAFLRSPPRITPAFRPCRTEMLSPTYFVIEAELCREPQSPERVLHIHWQHRHTSIGQHSRHRYRHWDEYLCNYSSNKFTCRRACRPVGVHNWIFVGHGSDHRSITHRRNTCSCTISTHGRRPATACFFSSVYCSVCCFLYLASPASGPAFNVSVSYRCQIIRTESWRTSFQSRRVRRCADQNATGMFAWLCFPMSYSVCTRRERTWTFEIVTCEP